MCGDLPDGKKGLWFTNAAGLASAIVGSESCSINDHIFLSQILEHGGPGLHIYPSGTGWSTYTSEIGLLSKPFRLAELRWRYSNPPPHGELLKSMSEFSFKNFRRTPIGNPFYKIVSNCYGSLCLVMVSALLHVYPIIATQRTIIR
jgi:hypothetical protein